LESFHPYLLPQKLQEFIAFMIVYPKTQKNVLASLELLGVNHHLQQSQQITHLFFRTTRFVKKLISSGKKRKI
jgi:hypothetical protein